MNQKDSRNDELVRYLKGEHKKRMLVIEPNNTLIYVDIDGEEAALDVLQTLVGGYVEIYPNDDDCYYCLVDEEGLLKKKPFNKLAYDLYGVEVVGTAVLVPKEYLK